MYHTNAFIFSPILIFDIIPILKNRFMAILRLCVPNHFEVCLTGASDVVFSDAYAMNMIF